MVNPFLNLEDEKLMELYQNGDNMAFEVIYSRHSSRVYSYLNRRVHNSVIVDDIFQSIFAKFHKSRMQYSSDYPLIKWLYTICRSEFLDALKKRKVIEVELSQEDTTISDIQEDFIIDLDEEKSLSLNELKALKLRYYTDEDFLEISKALQTSEANVRKLISRAIKKLRLKYQGELND